MKKQVAAVSAVLACAGLALAQAPQRVPRETVSASVGSAKVSIDYGRPALKGRALGELLKQLPEDRIWRAGENEVTTFSVGADVLVGGTKVAAGKYSLYVHIPDGGSWALVLNKDLGIALGKIWPAAPPAMAEKPWPRLDGYTKNVAAQEVARVPMKAGAPAAAVNVFTIALAEAQDGAALTLSWADKSYSLELKPAR